MKRRSFLKTTLGAGFLATLAALLNRLGSIAEGASRAPDNGTPPLSADPSAHSASVQASGNSISIPQGGSFNLASIEQWSGVPLTLSILQKQAELAAAGITLSGTSLVHDGRSNVGTNVAGTQYRASSRTSQELSFKEIAWAGTMPYPLHGVQTSVSFGKHWNFKRNPVDGKFYSIGGDAGVGGGYGGGGQTARTIRYDAVNKVLDYWYPYWGVKGSRPLINDEIFPFGQDQVHFMHRSNGGRNEFHVAGGYFDKVACQKFRDITVSIPAGQSVVELFTMKSYAETTSADIDGFFIFGNVFNQAETAPYATFSAPGLPAGVVIKTLHYYPPSSGGPFSYNSRINALGNQPGHGDDRAQFIAFIENKTGSAISVPPTPFTVTLIPPSGFSYTVTPAELPTTLKPGEAKFVKLNAPSFNENPTRWYVPCTSQLGLMHAPTLPADLNATVLISQINSWANTDGSPIWSIPGEEHHKAVIQVTLTNTTRSTINLVKERIWVSSITATRMTAPSPQNGQVAMKGFPYKGGVFVYKAKMPTGSQWTRPADIVGRNFPNTGEHTGFDYDTTLDCAWTAYQQKLSKYDPNTTTIVAEYPITGVTVRRARLAQAWCAETRELMIVHGNDDDGGNQETGKVIAISTAPGTEGRARVVCDLCVFGWYGASLVGQIPIVLVPPRHQVYVCTPEQPDAENRTGLYFRQGHPSYPVRVGGVFYADYRLSNRTATRIPYPTGSSPMDPAVTGYQQKMAHLAGYCPETDTIWMINKNATNIMHWGWS